MNIFQQLMAHVRAANLPARGAGPSDSRRGRLLNQAGLAIGACIAAGRRAKDDRRGNVLIIFGVALTVIIGAIGLGTDAASWYATKRAMQNTADLAAAGAIKTLKSYYPCSASCSTKAGYAKNEGKSAAALHGYVDGTGGVTVSIQVKGVDAALYSSTNYTGAVDYGAAEVVVTKPAPLQFSSLFLTSSPTITARALTRINVSAGDCMESLNPTQAKAFTLQGNVSVNVPCGLADASCNSTDAFDITGGSASITASGIRVCGGSSPGAGNSIFNNAPLTTGDNSITDPYASRILPTLATGYPAGTTWPGSKLTTITPTTANSYTPSGGTITSSTNTATMFPSGDCTQGCVINGSIGAATGGSKFTSSTLTLSAGVYFVTGSIWLGSNSKIVSTKATIILTNSNAANIGTFNMDSNASASMTPPDGSSTGTGAIASSMRDGVKGIAMEQDPRATTPTINSSNGNCSGNCSTLQGGPSDSITGAMYFPSGNLTWQGTGNTTSCFQLIGNSLTLAGNPGVSVSNCAEGEQTFGPTTVSMVE